MADEKIEIGMEPEQPAEAAEEKHDVFYQADPGKWLRQPPKIMCGDMREAMQCGRDADNYKCTCWNRRCPFFGDCRKCIAFHLALKQIPTCQREMVTEIYKSGVLATNLYIDAEETTEG